jgi:hypothetical protein
MKQSGKGPRKVNKGMPSAVLLSVLIHVGLFLIAGALVVFTVVKKEEQKFEPPQAVERPKMKLRKPKVKLKKSSKPRSTTRIVTRKNVKSMPDIQLPEMSGMGDGLGGGVGDGFDILLDFGETTIFGSGQSIGNDFVGTFYDFKRDRVGNSRNIDTATFKTKVADFVRSGWSATKLSDYYQSPKKLYATCFMVPTVRSSVAPAAFGEPETGGWCWIAHYKGDLVHEEGIKFRFWGQGDDILIVRVGSEVVLNASWKNTESIYCNWYSSDPKNRIYQMGNGYSVVGDWITLEPGVPVSMEVLCGEVPGGHFDAMLCVEVEGVDYEVNAQNGPILPMFKTAEPEHALRDKIYENLIEGEACITNGPVFCDFSAKEAPSPDEEVVPEPEAAAPVEEEGLRTWTMTDGKTVEAEYVSTIGSKVVLKSAKGKQVRITWETLSQEDRDHVELTNPPDFNIIFTKQSNQRIIETTPFLSEVPPQTFDWTFGVKLKQTSANRYNHAVTAEIFAVGQQFQDDRKYILLDRQATSFTPTKANQRSHVFKSPQTIETSSYRLKIQQIGRKYMGYLVLLKDERGKIIQYAASNEWLYEHHENLEGLPLGAFFDRTCSRVHPSGPKRWY